MGGVGCALPPGMERWEAWGDTGAYRMLGTDKDRRMEQKRTSRRLEEAEEYFDEEQQQSESHMLKSEKEFDRKHTLISKKNV